MIMSQLKQLQEEKCEAKRSVAEESDKTMSQDAPAKSGSPRALSSGELTGAGVYGVSQDAPARWQDSVSSFGTAPQGRIHTSLRIREIAEV